MGGAALPRGLRSYQPPSGRGRDSYMVFGTFMGLIMIHPLDKINKREECIRIHENEYYCIHIHY
jgi:hypothetical protein